MSPLSAILPALALLASEAHAADARYRTALFLSNNVAAGRGMLAYADTDALKLAGVLEDLGGFVDNTRVPQASADALREHLTRLASRVAEAGRRGQRTEVVVYYSGHSDEEGLLLGDERVSYTELKKRLDDIGADVQVAIVDSCASGALIRTKGSTPHAPFLVDRSSAVRGSAVLTSSSADEAAQESDRIEGSYFTHALVSGLRGAADASRDGRVSLTEAYHFAYGETLARTERTVAGAQHAAYDLDLAGTGDLVMTDLSVTEATLEIDEVVEGRVFVWKEPGGLVAELAKVQGQSVTLALPSGHYTVLVDERGQMAETSFDLARGDALQLSELGLHRAEAAWSRLRGESPLHERHQALSLSILPPISKRGEELLVQHAALALVANASDRLQGAQLSLGANLVDGDARGLQATTGVNLAGGPVQGLQLSVGANLARGVEGLGQWSVGGNLSAGPVRATQLSVGFNVAPTVQGAQVTVGGNVADALQGMQASVGVNVARELAGLQTGVGVNVAERLRGAQLGAGVQVAGRMDGAQIALVNVGGVVNGAQIGLVNIAKEVDGAQIGLVNVAAKVRGAPIGLLSVSGNGYNHAWAMGSDTTPLSLGLTSGGTRLYTLLEVGGRPDGLWTAGLGLGWHAPLVGRLFLDTDAAALNTIGPLPDLGAERLLVRGRALFGLELAPHLAVVGGPTLHLVPLGDARDLTVLPQGSVGGLPFWPGATLGLRF